MEDVMKKIILIFLGFLVAFPLFAQQVSLVQSPPNLISDPSAGSKLVHLDFVLDSAATLTSSAFSLEGFDGVDFDTYPATAFYYLVGDGSGAANDTVRILATIRAYDEYGNYAICDTIAADTIVNIGNTGAIQSSAALNFNDKRGKSYKFYITNLAVGSAITTGEITLYFPKRENYFYKN